MANEPQNDAKALLKRYAEARRKAAGGADAEVHPATRRMLQGEVARVHGAKGRGQGGEVRGGAPWWRGWLVSPQVGWALGLAMVLGVSFFALRAPTPRSGTGSQEEVAVTGAGEAKGGKELADVPAQEPAVAPKGRANESKVTTLSGADAAGGLPAQDLKRVVKDAAPAKDLVVAPTMPPPATVATDSSRGRGDVKSVGPVTAPSKAPVSRTRPGSLPSPIPAQEPGPMVVTVAPATASASAQKPTVKKAEARVAEEVDRRSLATQPRSEAPGVGGRAFGLEKAKQAVAGSEVLFSNSLSADNFARNQDGGGRDFGAGNNYANQDVLNRFSMRQSGSSVDFRDADGSSYTGRVVTLQAGTNVFRVAGMNRTLQQPVVFTGQLSQAAAPVVTTRATNAQVGLAEAQMRVQGQATVGTSNQIQVDAQRIAPGQSRR